MKTAVSTIILGLSVLAFSELARADDEVRVRPIDAYISVFGGIASPLKTDVTEGGITAKDSKLDNSASIGGKIGMWLTAPRKALGIDFGAEIDITHYSPDQKSGQVLTTSAGFPVITNAVDLSATFVGVNVLTRLPMDVTPELPNGRWFPYVGIGGGMQRVTFQTSGSTEGRDPSPAFQALGGFKVFLLKHVAVFGEAKFTHATHTLDFQMGSLTSSTELTLNTVHGVGGLSIHF